MKPLFVIPTYNEKDNIASLIKNIYSLIPSALVIVADDASPDGTGELAEGLRGIYRGLNVLHAKGKQGLGGAYLSAYRFARNSSLDFDCIVQMDADFSHNPAYIPSLISELEGCDMVIASRFAGMKQTNLSLLSLFANFFTRLLTGNRIKDCMGGFKCFRRKVIEKAKLEEFVSRDFVFQFEFNMEAMKNGFYIKELPFVYGARRSGKSKKTLNTVCEAFFKSIFITLRYLSPRA